jgi:asparagine synthetase B (glutamine-hydrolysing)
LPFGILNRQLPKSGDTLGFSSSSVEQLEHQLIESLRLRILNIPEPPFQGTPTKVKLAILFSGGLDCTVLASIAHQLLPPDHEIDLLNVAFENPRVIHASKQAPKTKKPKNKRYIKPTESEHLVAESFSKVQPDAIIPDQADGSESPSPYEACPDRITGRSAVEELRSVFPGRTWRFVEVWRHSF